MRDQQQMMIDKQAEIITNLRNHLAALEQRLDAKDREIEKLRLPADYYLNLQKAVMDNPMLQEMWDQITVTMRMLGGEAEKAGKGTEANAAAEARNLSIPYSPFNFDVI